MHVYTYMYILYTFLCAYIYNINMFYTCFYVFNIHFINVYTCNKSICVFVCVCIYTFLAPPLDN